MRLIGFLSLSDRHNRYHKSLRDWHIEQTVQIVRDANVDLPALASSLELHFARALSRWI